MEGQPPPCTKSSYVAFVGAKVLVSCRKPPTAIRAIKFLGQLFARVTLASSSREAQATKQSAFACRADRVLLASNVIGTPAGLWHRGNGPRDRSEIREIPLASRCGFEELAGIGLLRIGQHLGRRSLFDNPAALHHRDVVTDLSRNA